MTSPTQAVAETQAAIKDAEQGSPATGGAAPRCLTAGLTTRYDSRAMRSAEAIAVPARRAHLAHRAPVLDLCSIVLDEKAQSRRSCA